LYIPRGFAHGFVVLSDTALFSYKCDNIYCKESEGAINPFDEELNINWEINQEDVILSEKDKLNPNITEFDNPF
jgi:dTDP-4-dehydrorhamnose 3,5-epimerase